MTVLTVISVMAILPVSAAPANTAAQALGAVAAFLPGTGTPPPAPDYWAVLSGPNWDILPTYAAIHQSLQDALAGITSGTPDNYSAVLDTEYQQTDNSGKQIGMAEIETRLKALLSRNRCSSAQFGLVGLQMTAADAATVTVRQHLEFLSLDTPPALIKTPDGKMRVVNNTNRAEIDLLLSEDWVRHGDVWRLKASRTLQSKQAAVL